MRLFTWLIGILSLLIALAIPTVASAHELQVDGHISAVLHTDPDDNPTANAPTAYTLFFNDDTGKFSLPACNCTVTITSKNRIWAAAPLIVTSNGISENTFTFPNAATYTIAISGSPKTPGAFQPFTLKYVVPVATGQSNMQTFSPLLWVGVATTMVLILLLAYGLNRS